MKKFLTVILSVICFALTFAFAACGDTPTDGDDTPTPTRGNVLVAYFTWSSNTERMAQRIANKTGGALYKIEPETPYPSEYTECTEVALEERDNNARPEIKNPIDISGYDTVFIGYPIWWHTAPMIIGTFLENNDLTGKDIYPFTQSASMDREQFDNSMEFVRDCAKGATVHDGLFARSGDTNSIDEYLKGVALAPKANAAKSGQIAREVK